MSGGIDENSSPQEIRCIIYKDGYSIYNTLFSVVDLKQLREGFKPPDKSRKVIRSELPFPVLPYRQRIRLMFPLRRNDYCTTHYYDIHHHLQDWFFGTLEYIDLVMSDDLFEVVRERRFQDVIDRAGRNYELSRA